MSNAPKHKANWYLLFDSGVQPRDVLADTKTYFWFKSSQKRSMYRAYANWLAKRKGQIGAQVEVVSELPEQLRLKTRNELIEEIADRMVIKITQESFSAKLEATQMIRELMLQIGNEPGMSVTQKMQALRVLIEYVRG